MICPEPAYVSRRGWRLAYVAIGSNLGDRWRHVARGVCAMAALPRTRLLRRSTVIETDPVGPAPQERYLNAVVELETALAPRELLDALLAAELAEGRIRDATTRWGPRTLDLDLILYGDQEIDEPGLTVPHPRLAERPFVLGPLAELVPGARIPGAGLTAGEALAALERPA